MQSDQSKDAVSSIGAQLARQSCQLGELEWQLREKESLQLRLESESEKLVREKQRLEKELAAASESL
ncbi:hypothetical protein HK405_000324, partial [Cladochytrium tenue]